MVVKKQDWIGKPLGPNKRHNVFVTGRNTMPVNLFKDSDKDGVMNVFDCKPHNKNKQGFIDAVIQGAKGLVTGSGARSGWREGMEKPGNYATRYVQRKKIERVKREFNQVPTSEKSVEVVTPEVSGELSADYVKALRTKGLSNEQINRAARKLKEKVTAGMDKYNPTPKQRFKKAGYGVINRIQRADPRYNVHEDFRMQKIKLLEQQIADPRTSPLKKVALQSQLARTQLVQRKHVATKQLEYSEKKQKFGRAIIREAFPQAISYKDVGKGYRAVGKPGQRGRPIGSLDPRYVQYGGVFGYRKYLSRMKQQEKIAKQEALKAMKQARQPVYEQQQYQQQVPQELQGTQVTPDYSQYQQQVQQPQQYQQAPVQQPQQAIRREIKTVFKSSGGSPYPPVSNQPIAPTSATMPYGYVEAVDAFTGRRYMKPLPKKEAWSG